MMNKVQFYGEVNDCDCISVIVKIKKSKPTNTLNGCQIAKIPDYQIE